MCLGFFLLLLFSIISDGAPLVFSVLLAQEGLRIYFWSCHIINALTYVGIPSLGISLNSPRLEWTFKN